MPFIQILNVHASEGCSRRGDRDNNWRAELCDQVELFVNNHFEIDGEYTEMFLPHDPSTPINAPVTVFVDYLPEDDKCGIEERGTLSRALGYMLELRIQMLRLKLGPGVVRRVHVRVICRDCFTAGGGHYYLSLKVDKNTLLESKLPLNVTQFEERMAGALERMEITNVYQLVRQTTVTLEELDEEEFEYIIKMLALDGLRLGMDEEAIDAWLQE